MVNLIDYNYFTGNILIANSIESSFVQQEISNLIKRYQVNFLKELLGLYLYNDFELWFNLQNTNSVWFDLLKGKQFESNGRLIEWTGFANGINSPLANYIYFYYKKTNATQTVSSGEANTNMQNANNASSYDKMKDAWNEMVHMLTGFCDFMNIYFANEAKWINQKQLTYNSELLKRILFI